MANGFNEANDVLLFKYDLSSDEVSCFNGTETQFYAFGILKVTTVYDENGNEVIDFRDNEDHLVLKRIRLNEAEFIETYYVYDEVGRLITVVTPEAVTKVRGASH
jgi:hypothetical protein